MNGKIVIDKDRCKGCGLCVAVCPSNNIQISPVPNKKGYLPAEAGTVCTGCTLCAVVCPDVVIEVYRDKHAQIVSVAAPGKKSGKSADSKTAVF